MKNKLIITLFLAGFLLLPLVNHAGAATTVPTPIAPSGTITDTTPTYKWSKVAGATKYRFKTIKGSTTVYTITVTASACGTTTCKKTPTQALSEGSHTWKVQAYVNGAWKTYSALKTFAVSQSTGGPKAGFWEGGGSEFYVTPDSKNVDNFAVYINLTPYGCSIYKITYNPLIPITSGKFSFTGSFYGSGTFDTATSAHGTVGFQQFSISGCGIVTGTGTWPEATWQDSSQPTVVAFEDEGSDAALSQRPSVIVEEIEVDASALTEGILDSFDTIELEPDNQ